MLQDLRIAFRAALQRPGFSAAAVLTLALGIGATIGIFSVLQGILLRPLPFPDAHRLFVVGQTSPNMPTGVLDPISHLNFLDIRDGSATFESLALFIPAEVTVTGLGDAVATAGAQVSADFFAVLGAPPLLGRTFTPDEMVPGGPRAIIVSHAFWQDRLGGARDVLDRTLSVGGVPRPIVGVTRPDFAYPAGARVYAPIRPDDEGCGRGCSTHLAIGRLAPHAGLGEATAELATIGRNLAAAHPATNAGVSLGTRSLLDHTVGDVRTPLYLLLAAVLMLLLIACSNVANLVMVRGVARSQELTLRAVLGARRGRILRLLMIENLLLSVTGAALGVLLATWGVEVLRAVAPPGLPRLDEIAVDGRALVFAVVLALLTTLIFGLLPALGLSARSMAAAARGGRSEIGQRHAWRRSSILVVEVALATVLLLSAGLLLRTLSRIYNVEPGFDAAPIAAFTVGLPGVSYGNDPARFAAFFDALLERLHGLRGVEAAGIFSPLPLSSGGATPFVRNDVPSEPGREPAAILRVADAGGMRALGIEVRRGRGFEAQDRADSPPVALVNAAAAQRYWPDGDPVGRQLRVAAGTGFETAPRTVIGVVQDIRGVALTQPPEPEILLPYAQLRGGVVTLVTRSGDPGAMLAAARAEVGALDPNVPLIAPAPFADVLAAQVAGTRFYLVLIGIFAGLAATLAALGIYSVVAFLVASRSREIGMRMALGASTRQIVSLILWQGVGPALAGLLLGLAGAVAGGRIIGGMLYGVGPNDPATYLTVALLLVTTALLACIVPALRALRIAPAEALRSD